MSKLPYIVIAIMLIPLAIHAADVSGIHDNPNVEFGKDANLKLVGDTTFGWRTSTLTGAIDLNSHALIMDTGGGNLTVFSGAISGKGPFEWRGGSVPQVAASILNGDKANTFQGTFTLSKGVLDLDKPAGIDAIPGDLIIGGKGSALVKLDKPNQINDAATVTLAGPDISGLDLQGHDEEFASLIVQTHGAICMGEGPASLVIGDCSRQKWDLTKTLTIFGYTRGKHRIAFGTDRNGLTKTQLQRIGFAMPAGPTDALFTAKMDGDGTLAPDAMVHAINPPFDISPEAIADREKRYVIYGLANLCGEASPLKDGMTIAFFGDSITWQNGFISKIDNAIKTSPATKAKQIKLINRGINGGGVSQIRDGAKEGGFPGSSEQKPFAQLIEADKVDLAVVYIGINDVWWRKTSPEVFEKALRDLVTSAQANKTRLVLATLSLHGELPDGKNSDDTKIEQFAEITRKVAADTATTVVDLRSAYIAYLQNHNAQLRVDGTIYSKPSGILTYDGVHPSEQGATLLAYLIGDGIFRAAQISPKK